MLAVATTVGISSCAPDPNSYSQYRDLPDEGWRYGDTITFTPLHPDSISRGIIVAGIRHSATFPYTSLWLEISGDNAGRQYRDTIEMRLTDSFGSWTGRGIGASFQVTDTLPRPVRHISGHPVKIRHIMRDDTLSGVSQIGIFFIPLTQ